MSVESHAVISKSAAENTRLLKRPITKAKIYMRIREIMIRYKQKQAINCSFSITIIAEKGRFENTSNIDSGYPSLHVIILLYARRAQITFTLKINK